MIRKFTSTNPQECPIKHYYEYNSMLRGMLAHPIYCKNLGNPVKVCRTFSNRIKYFSAYLVLSGSCLDSQKIVQGCHR